MPLPRRTFQVKGSIQFKKMWRCGGLNPGPFTCKANALPLSYIPVGIIQPKSKYISRAERGWYFGSILGKYHLCVWHNEKIFKGSPFYFWNRHRTTLTLIGLPLIILHPTVGLQVGIFNPWTKPSSEFIIPTVTSP